MKYKDRINMETCNITAITEHFPVYPETPRHSFLRSHHISRAVLFCMLYYYYVCCIIFLLPWQDTITKASYKRKHLIGGGGLALKVPGGSESMTIRTGLHWHNC